MTLHDNLAAAYNLASELPDCYQLSISSRQEGGHLSVVCETQEQAAAVIAHLSRHGIDFPDPPTRTAGASNLIMIGADSSLSAFVHYPALVSA